MHALSGTVTDDNKFGTAKTKSALYGSRSAWSKRLELEGTRGHSARGKRKEALKICLPLWLYTGGID
jgi:hypothetical protein